MEVKLALAVFFNPELCQMEFSPKRDRKVHLWEQNVCTLNGANECCAFTNQRIVSCLLP